MFYVNLKLIITKLILQSVSVDVFSDVENHLA